MSDWFDISGITTRSLAYLLLLDHPIIVHGQRLVHWLNMEFCSLHRWMRQLERQYRCSRFPYNWTVWIHSVRVMHSKFRKKIVTLACKILHELHCPEWWGSAWTHCSRMPMETTDGRPLFLRSGSSHPSFVSKCSCSFFPEPWMLNLVSPYIIPHNLWSSDIGHLAESPYRTVVGSCTLNVIAARRLLLPSRNISKLTIPYWLLSI